MPEVAAGKNRKHTAVTNALGSGRAAGGRAEGGGARCGRAGLELAEWSAAPPPRAGIACDTLKP